MRRIELTPPMNLNGTVIQENHWKEATVTKTNNEKLRTQGKEEGGGFFGDEKTHGNIEGLNNLEKIDRETLRRIWWK